MELGAQISVALGTAAGKKLVEFSGLILNVLMHRLIMNPALDGKLC